MAKSPAKCKRTVAIGRRIIHLLQLSMGRNAVNTKLKGPSRLLQVILLRLLQSTAMSWLSSLSRRVGRVPLNLIASLATPSLAAGAPAHEPANSLNYKHSWAGYRAPGQTSSRFSSTTLSSTGTDSWRSPQPSRVCSKVWLPNCWCTKPPVSKASSNLPLLPVAAGRSKMRRRAVGLEQRRLCAAAGAAGARPAQWPARRVAAQPDPGATRSGAGGIRRCPGGRFGGAGPHILPVHYGL